MAKQWRGVLHEYADRLDVSAKTPIITLGEGGTPLIPAPALSARTGAKERRCAGQGPWASRAARCCAVG